MQPVDTYLDFSSAAKQFWAAPDEALFPQAALVAVTGLSNAHFERCRWQGDGPKFIKLGRLVRYRKSDVIAWIEKRPAVSSTTEAAEKFGPQFGSPRGPRKKPEQSRAKLSSTSEAKSARRTSSGRNPSQNEIERTT
jgi:predicted DNA-binding transcriptional regulator AlpA